MTSTVYWLTNVRLETGYHYDNGTVTGTKTDLFIYKLKMGK